MGKLTKQQQQMIVVGAFGAIFGLYVYWNYLLKPQLDAIKARETQYQDLVQKIEVVERQARRLPALLNEREKLRTELSGLEKQLPKDRDLPNVIRILTREALQENLLFSRLAPRPTTRQQYFEVIPFEVGFTGSLQALARFLSALGQQDRIFQAQNITLTPVGAVEQGLANLNITLTIMTYAYSG